MPALRAFPPATFSQPFGLPKYFYLAQIEYLYSFKLSGNLPVPKLS